MKSATFGALVLGLLLFPGMARAASVCQPLDPYVPSTAKDFASFRQQVAASARKARQEDLAKQVDSLPAASQAVASCLLRRYVVARYGERMVKDLQEMVGFRTFAEEGKENWTAPEFGRQRQWLEKRARELGLAFKSFDGRVEEITLAGPAPILAVLTHGDVQNVEGQQWISPPWEGKIVDGKIIGRGTEDDKGPIVVTLYSMAALRETGWPLGYTLRLLVANAEESSWEDVPYYLERAPMPERTIGVDANYPVTHAQKAFGILTFRSAAVDKPAAGNWRVAGISGGSGLSIIPERGEARVEWAGDAKEQGGALERLTSLATAWAAAHPPARLTVSRDGDLLKVAAEGRGGHTSEPGSGHGALGDLTAFLASLKPRQDAWGAFTSFVGTAVGRETDGASLGIAHRHEVMGALTSILVTIGEEGGAPVGRVNIRVPRGIEAKDIESRLADRAAAFSKRSGAKVTTESKLFNEPHLVPAEGEVVSGLMEVWEQVTGEPGRPVAIGGGTQARLFKGGVDFGPAWPGLPYRGHGTDEYLTVEELHRIAELTVGALWRLGRAQ